MSTIKTRENEAIVEDFINSVDGEQKRADAFTLLAIYKKVTGQKPKMWGTSMIGFGKYHYKSERSRQEGDWPLGAFSPRKQNLSLYLMNYGFNYSDLFSKLGKHKTSKACVYINKLSDVDLHVLEALIRRSYQDAVKTLVNK